jgi:hypothetical protein
MGYSNPTCNPAVTGYHREGLYTSQGYGYTPLYKGCNCNPCDVAGIFAGNQEAFRTASRNGI